MNITKLVISAALVALVSAPASARIDGDEGGLSAYPQFRGERAQSQVRNGDFGRAPDVLINRPRQR